MFANGDKFKNPSYTSWFQSWRQLHHLGWMWTYFMRAWQCLRLKTDKGYSLDAHWNRKNWVNKSLPYWSYWRGIIIRKTKIATIASKVSSDCQAIGTIQNWDKWKRAWRERFVRNERLRCDRSLEIKRRTKETKEAIGNKDERITNGCWDRRVKGDLQLKACKK